MASSKQDLFPPGLGTEGTLAAEAAVEVFLDHELARLKDRARRHDSEPGQWREASRMVGASTWMTVYFQFNGVGDQRPETLAAFCERLFTFIDSHQVSNLVVDLRWNGGGNTSLVQPLLHRLIGCAKINQPGCLYVIIGRGTFSLQPEP